VQVATNTWIESLKKKYAMRLFPENLKYAFTSNESGQSGEGGN
jgi:hypothetical protein